MLPPLTEAVSAAPPFTVQPVPRGGGANQGEWVGVGGLVHSYWSLAFTTLSGIVTPNVCVVNHTVLADVFCGVL